jgi:hypothetical protein
MFSYRCCRRSTGRRRVLDFTCSCTCTDARACLLTDRHVVGAGLPLCVVLHLSGGAVLCSPAGAHGHRSFERASVRAPRLENLAVWKKQAEAGALLLPRVSIGGGPRFGRRRRRSGFSRSSARSLNRVSVSLAALTRPAPH